MKTLATTLATLFALSISPFLQAEQPTRTQKFVQILQESAYFKQPASWAGTGCRAGSDSVVVRGKNTDTLKISFESFDAGKESESGKKRVACSFSVPIKVPRGFQISHLTADWEGYIDGKGQFSRKYYLAGRPYTSWKRNTYRKPNGGNFTKNDNIYNHSLATHCNGGTYILRINSQIRAIGRNSYASTYPHGYLALPNSLKLSLRFKACRYLTCEL